MALGRSHDFVNLLALPACLYFVPKEFFIPFVGGYLVGTFLFSPDIDLPRSKPSKRWKTLRFIWRPYQAVSKHRGVSHVPILGTFLRLTYFLSVFLFFYLVLIGISSNYLPELKEFLLGFDIFELFSGLAKREEIFYFALGVVLSEIFHVSLDLLISGLKRFKI